MLALGSAMNRNPVVSLTPTPLKQRAIYPALGSHHRNNQQQLLQREQQLSPTSEHYIHTRLKSALGSGRKETLYSGVLEGDRVRRVASLNAQAMNQMLCLTESALPVHSQKKAASDFVSALSSHEVELMCVPAAVNGTPSCDNQSTTESEESQLGIMRKTTSTHPDEGSRSAGNARAAVTTESLASPPSSSTSSSSSPIKVTSSPMQATLKNASVEVVDVMKTRKRSRRNVDAKKPKEANPTASVVDYTTGFVKRIASLNARACVAVLVGPARPSRGSLATQTSACSPSSSSVGSVAGRKRCRASSNFNHNNSKRRKDGQEEHSAEGGKSADGGDSSGEGDGKGSQSHPTGSQLLPQQSTSHQSSSIQGSLVCAGTSHVHVELRCSESVSSSSEETNDEEHQQEHSSQPCSLERVPHNTLGLLYNGDCVDVNTSIFFTTEGYMPDRVIPLIEPARAFEVNLTKAQVLKQNWSAVRRRRAKGNNGWTAISEPIKTITVREQGGSKRCRKYFIGLRRRQQKLFVRDCVLIRSSKKKNENPYVAKISSIWQEGGEAIMLTVFWYYRPEDTTKNVSALFHETEVMASQHHDDVSIACVDDKCLVLGFSQFCRFMAAKKRKESGVSTHSIVPALSPNEGGVAAHYLHQQRGVNSPQPGDESLEVYVCYRAYNHLTGRVLRAGSISYK